MSENPTNARRGGERSQECRDRGMTLPEVLVSIVVMGLIVSVLSSAVIVTLRQQSSTEGRLNVARSEQSVSMWIPADLASAHEVHTEPDMSPCGAPVCPGGIDLTHGSNVVMMTWYVDTNSNGEGVMTNVGYHFAPSADGVTYELSRVECTRPYTKNAAGEHVLQGSWTCTSMVVLHDLDGPPNDEFGNPVPFIPGVTSPTWVIRVTEPLAPDAVAGPSDDGPTADPSQWKDANRVIVTIDGGGSAAGAGGGRNQISITAGGTTRQEINSRSMLGSPSFVAAKSRCGGPIALVIDESGSIGSNITKVQTAVREFVQALRGTPVQIQIVTFTEYSRVLGAPGEWHKYFDMTDPAQADALYNASADIQLRGAGGSGYTNWEEGLYRVAYNPDGTLSTSDLPQTLVFFTDGIPNRDRNVNKTAPWNAPDPQGYPTSSSAIWGQLNRSAWPSSSTYNYSSDFHQVAFNRAEWIATVLRGKTKLIGVGVGDFGSSSKSNWRYGPGPGDRTAVSTPNRDILADLIVGDVVTKTPPGRSAQMGELVGGEYVNPDTAELYIPDWSLLPEALRAVALGQCAGTITMQTRSAVPDGSGKYPYLDRPVRYLAQEVKNPDGTPGKEKEKYVETNVQFTARTFDLEIPGGAYVDVEMVPMDFSDLASRGYTTNRWECTVAGEPVAGLASVPTANPLWNGFGIRVGANRAVSCTHFVNPP